MSAAPAAPASATLAATPGEWLGFPKGAWLVIGVEFWERCSFYGMLSILALFLTANPATGGFGWPAASALALVGAYSGAMYALPALGGYIADRVLGRRRAVTLGGGCMLAGQGLLAMPASLLDSLGRWRGAPLAFYGALACLVLGNALMKSTLVVLCGETLRIDDPRREAAFTIYYLGIAVGAMLSGVVVGTVAERYGWHAGFSVAAAGMAVALASYVMLARRWLGSIGVAPDRRAPRATTVATRSNGAAVMASRLEAPLEARRRIGLLLILALMLCAFSIGWFQLFGSWLLFLERDVDRALGSFVIPVPWFTSMNAAVVIVTGLVRVSLRLDERLQGVDIVQKYIFALSMVALAHGLMLISARGATPDSQSSLWLSLVSLSLLGFGELVAWTATYGLVSRAAPAGYSSVAMGAWYLMTLGLGGYLSGFTGGLVDAYGFPATFALVAIAMTAAGVAAVGLRRPLSRLAARAGVSL